MKKLTTAEFIERAKNVHGDRYDYSKLEYVGANNKVEIVCPEHGTYSLTPSEHLRGRGCKKCNQQKRLSAYNFIGRANRVHKGRYDYSKTEYKGADIKLTITCPDHGDFVQRPADHLRGHGCRKCEGLRKSKASTMGEKAFIQKAIEKHGNRYDYYVVDYVNSKTKVTIICPEHGPFDQRPDLHLRGNGCPVCRYIKSGKANALTADRFIKQAIAVHGDRYDYSKVDYVNGETPVIIICPEHGPFEKRPVAHIHMKVGCPECMRIHLQERFRKTTDQFIKEARSMHGDQYNYSLVDYQTALEPVTIVCPDHGPFKQTPSSHLSGIGCRDCGYLRNSQTFRMSQEEFIKRCTERHKGKYSYDFVDYQGVDKKVKIICPEHGVFEQIANDHLAGCGCVYCQESGFQPGKPAILYYVRVECDTGDLWKIGITNRTLEERYAGPDLNKIATIKTWSFETGLDALTREQEILNQYSTELYCGTEKPLESGNTELFIRDVLGLDPEYN